MRDDLAKLLMLGFLVGAVSPQKSQKTWKQKFSTMLGLMMLSFFVVLILTMGAIRWASFDEVRNQLDVLATKVSHLDHAALMNWAAGNEKDCWGNTFVLETNYENVQFRSKGPDGVLGTKDDILGKLCLKDRPKYTKPVEVVEKEPEKSLLSKAYQKYKSWRGDDK